MKPVAVSQNSEPVSEKDHTNIGTCRHVLRGRGLCNATLLNVHVIRQAKLGIAWDSGFQIQN